MSVAAAIIVQQQAVHTNLSTRCHSARGRLQCSPHSRMVGANCIHGVCMADAQLNNINRKIQAALSSRVDRILLILEHCTDNRNYLACLRTCDILGVQNVWIIDAPGPTCSSAQQTTNRVAHGPAATAHSTEGLAYHVQGTSSSVQSRKKGRIARSSNRWLDVQHFNSSSDAIQELKAGGWTIWVTDLSPGAVELSGSSMQLPPLLAVVMGSEASGISSDMRTVADRCIYLPMYGFTESLNVSVAAALVLQVLITADPSVRGQLIGEGRGAQLLAKWKAAAARTHSDISADDSSLGNQQ